VKAIPPGLGYRQDVLDRAFAEEQEKNDCDEHITADGLHAPDTASFRHSSFVGSCGEDIFLNFTQFYHIIVYMAEVVYPSLSHISASSSSSSSSAQLFRAQVAPMGSSLTGSALRAMAVEKLVQEAVVPLYTWCQGNSIEGCVDPLLTDRCPSVLQCWLWHGHE
jgi:hypothetical protein